MKDGVRVGYIDAKFTCTKVWAMETQNGHKWRQTTLCNAN